MPLHADCVEKLKALRTCLSEELTSFDQGASLLLQNGVFRIPDILDKAQEDVRKTLMVPAILRKCLTKLDVLILQKDILDNTVVLSKIDKIFREEPKDAEQNISLGKLFSSRTRVLSKRERLHQHAQFGFAKSSEALYISCLSRKTLEHLNDLRKALDNANPTPNESVSHDGSADTIAKPGSGTSPH